ncbi:hypothetical protein [Roseovarius sp. TE539]|uniref:hypothetical protein n=1 Tax=Roseovarius sp. TE539 TaxID=2249812 RepID=UPI0011BE27E4|nr:hypothetical protein [Roseovarius sp. TE539]
MSIAILTPYGPVERHGAGPEPPGDRASGHIGLSAARVSTTPTAPPPSAPLSAPTAQAMAAMRSGVAAKALAAATPSEIQSA